MNTNNLFDKEVVFDPPVSKWWHYFAYAALLFILIYIANIDVAFAAAEDEKGFNAWTQSGVETNLTAKEVWTAETHIEEKTAVAPVEPAYHTETFTISAYYSPQEGQSRYVTGSYAGDIRLNGGGVHGADGTPVYPGMIAAPSTIPFGTKMHIPGIGTVAVHDRGGAIKGSRLDVWMGYGDLGLQRALKWGKRTLEVKVYGINPDIQEQVELEGYSESERQYVAVAQDSDDNANTVTVSYHAGLFSNQLKMGSTGADVGKLQQILKDLDYYEGEITSVFDNATHDAVAKFQVAKNIIDSPSSYGAGYVGPVTSISLSGAMVNTGTAHAKSGEIETDGIFSMDLKPGDNGEAVWRLQKELKNVNLFGIEPTGYYGELTEHAIFKFQQTYKLAGDKSSTGAGIFGPVTRSKMNEIVAARLKIEELVNVD